MDKPTKIPTDRSFGWTFAIVFALLGGWLLWNSSRFGMPAFGVAAVFALLAVLAPRLLHRLNVVWAYVGLLLNKIVSPIVLGLIFFVAFTPVALFFRVTGRDALRRKFDPNLTTYWIDRTPPGPDRSTLRRQF